MSEISDFFNLLYRKFFMRDFLAKIVPGFILLFLPVITYKVYIQKNAAIEIIDAPIWIVPFFIGIFWLIGFSIQGIGDVTGSIQYWDRLKIPKRSDWYTKYRNAQGKDKDIGDFERFIFIREALGNFFLSLFFGGIISIILLIDKTRSSYNWIFLLSVFVFIVNIVVRKVSINFFEKNDMKNSSYCRKTLKVSFYVEDFLYIVIAAWLFFTKPWIESFNDNSQLILTCYLVILLASHIMHLIHVERLTQWAQDLD